MLPRRPIRSSVSAAAGAFQSADWLDEEVARLYTDRIGAQRMPWGLRAAPPRELGAHHWFISDYSTGGRFSPLDSSSTRPRAHAELAGRVEDFATRSIRGIAGADRIIARASLVRLGWRVS